MSALYWFSRAVSCVRSVASRHNGSLDTIVNAVAKDLKVPLTSVSVMKGNSMAPTLNENTEKGIPGDKLVIRRLLQPVLKEVFEKDVVVVTDPENGVTKYVRRITGLPGEKMVSSDSEEDPFVLDKAYWVLCDNTTCEEPDSRTFGPVPMENVVGRVIYRYRSKTDHDFVKNSPQARFGDELVFAYEAHLHKSKI
mmetsp:Transcript_644/g.2145  ORF Transcript_644/g.2145 Transcript_644/m.2145 type:complete len:195 (+) Transcript_644:201-785(+)